MRMRPKNKDFNSKKKNKQSAPKAVPPRKSSGTLDERKNKICSYFFQLLVKFVIFLINFVDYENDLNEAVKNNTISENIQITSNDETVAETTPLAGYCSSFSQKNLLLIPVV